MRRHRRAVAVAAVAVTLATVAAVPWWQAHQREAAREQISTVLLQGCLDAATTEQATDACLEQYAAR